MPTMDVQPITYRGRIVAACTRECFLLADDLAYRAPGDLELVFVVAMCSYASDIARGLLPGPFDAADACRYARAFLIPEELLERPELDVDRAAAALGVPADELRAARDEHQAWARGPRRALSAGALARAAGGCASATRQPDRPWSPTVAASRCRR
jgi:hypothetical protein